MQQNVHRVVAGRVAAPSQPFQPEAKGGQGEIGLEPDVARGEFAGHQRIVAFNQAVVIHDEIPGQHGRVGGQGQKK